MTTETAEIVEALYKSTMLGQTEAVLRPSGTNRKTGSPLMESLNNPEIKSLLAMLVLTGMLGREDSYAAAVASGITYGYDSDKMASATALLLSDTYKDGVEIEGTDINVSYSELTEISTQILSMATNQLPEEFSDKFLSDKAKFSFCVVFGAEYAKYHKGLAALDTTDFSATTVKDDNRVSPEEQVVQEVGAWQTAISITMARVADLLEHPEKAAEHERIGDYMPDVFFETMTTISQAVHTMGHEKGGEIGDCESDAHQRMMMRAMFMFGRAVEEFSTSRLHHLDELRFDNHGHHHH